MVKTLHENHAYPIAALCRLLEVSRSRYYYASAARADATGGRAVQAVAAEFPSYGSRRIAAQLRRVLYPVNRKQLQRHMRAQGLLRPPQPTASHAMQRTSAMCDTRGSLPSTP